MKVLLGNMHLVRELESDKRILQEFNLALEQRVAERTKELAETNRQLADLLGALREKEQRIIDDLEQARAFQQSILPTLAGFPRALVHAYFRPLELVGGDFYDVCQLSDKHFRIFVADATGHGVQAAMRTIVLKAEYDRVKFEIGNPSALLEAFNRNLVTLYSRSEMLCTACCLDVIVKDGGARVRYANAAQPPVIRSRAALERAAAEAHGADVKPTFAHLAARHDALRRAPEDRYVVAERSAKLANQSRLVVVDGTVKNDRLDCLVAERMLEGFPHLFAGPGRIGQLR